MGNQEYCIVQFLSQVRPKIDEERIAPPTPEPVPRAVDRPGRSTSRRVYPRIPSNISLTTITEEHSSQYSSHEIIVQPEVVVETTTVPGGVQYESRSSSRNVSGGSVFIFCSQTLVIDMRLAWNEQRCGTLKASFDSTKFLSNSLLLLIISPPKYYFSAGNHFSLKKKIMQMLLRSVTLILYVMSMYQLGCLSLSTRGSHFHVFFLSFFTIHRVRHRALFRLHHRLVPNM